jgi:hypothetical protein
MDECWSLDDGRLLGIRGKDDGRWEVWLCDGTLDDEHLGWFATRDEAWDAAARLRHLIDPQREV